jgi:hypothetical protein
MIDGVVSPFDQRIPFVEEVVSVTVSPSQNVVAPLTETVGIIGVGSTVMTITEVSEVQPLIVEATSYVPLVVMVVDCVMSPFDQRFPLISDEVKTTFPPSQNVVGPFAEIIGVAGTAFTVIVTAAELGEVQLPNVSFTE